MREEGVWPYWGSCEWYRLWIAEESFPQAQGHDLTRITISNSSTHQLFNPSTQQLNDSSTHQLTVPLEGGFRQLRRTLCKEELSGLRLSGHGGWQHNHKEALRAIYGKAPFFSHYFPAIAEVYDSIREGDSFAAFTRRLHGIVEGVLGEKALEPFLGMREQEPELFAALHRERGGYALSQLSILHPLFHLGPEMPFSLINIKQQNDI